MRLFVALVAAGGVLWPRGAEAYSALAHRAVIDAAWQRSLEPLLRARYRLTPEELRKARAHAYAGMPHSGSRLRRPRARISRNAGAEITAVRDPAIGCSRGS